jgi:redox-sensitive bicupin YhaK (pirin superfamily)
VSADVIERDIAPATRDLGDGFLVRRALPSAECRAIGPFVFFDQFGPTNFTAGAGLDVRPHPHIGLATVTYLFEGEIVHRDSLGNEQVIRPGEVNWMIAGAGIVHSERTGASVRRAASTLAGIQTWVALPREHEQRPASFAHHAAHELPLIEGAGRRVRVIAGALFAARAPVMTLSAMGYADALLESGSRLQFECEYEQRAIYIVGGAIESGGRRFEAAHLLVLRARECVTVQALVRSRLMLLGGEPLDGPRHLWWNFVSSSRERIAEAKAAWRERRFGIVPGDEEEFIPLPPEPVRPEAANSADDSETL